MLHLPQEEVEDLLGCELRSITASLQGVVKSKSDPSELVDVLPSPELPLMERANLTPKERTVVVLRFGLDDSHEWRTPPEVAR